MHKPGGVAILIGALKSKGQASGEDVASRHSKIKDMLDFMHSEGESNSEGPSEGHIAAAKDILSAIEAKDPQLLAESLHDFYLMCESSDSSESSKESAHEDDEDYIDSDSRGDMPQDDKHP